MILSLKFKFLRLYDAYIFVSRTITIPSVGADDTAKQTEERKEEVIFINCSPLTACIREINNSQIYNANDIDLVMPMCNSIEYSDNYSKVSVSLWQYCRDEPAATILNFDSFQCKIRITRKIPATGNLKDVKKSVIHLVHEVPGASPEGPLKVLTTRVTVN